VWGKAEIAAVRNWKGEHGMNELKCRFVGVDWASENHRVRITDGCGMRVGQRDFAHGGTGLAEMAAWAHEYSLSWGRCNSRRHRNAALPIVESLLDRGFNIYAINPKQLDRFGDAACSYRQPGALVPERII
jgi:Transposase